MLKTTPDINRSIHHLALVWATSQWIVFATATPLALAHKELGGFTKYRIPLTKKSVLLFIIAALQPLLLWVTTARIISLYSTVVGLYCCLPLVLALFIYGGELVGMIMLTVNSAISVLCVFAYQNVATTMNPYERPVEIRIAGINMFLTIMSIVCLVHSAIVRERNAALASVECKVKQRTSELRRALDELEKAKAETEQLSRQKSEFMVR
jgi:hypothetical protein